MPPICVMIKPASGACNMRCKYCFYKDVADNRAQSCYGMMQGETLENTIRKALDFADHQCTIVFQGGEPTLVGLDFYKQVVCLQKQYNRKGLVVQNAIQTNGLLLDDDWAAFLAENHFLVGLSVDGGKDTHDAFRVDTQGKGTHNRVMHAVTLLRKHKVEFNILTVVNARTARYINSAYAFFKKNGLQHLQFIPCLDPFGAEQGAEDFSLTTEHYGDFLCTLFDLWYRDYQQGNYVYIRFFENLVGMLLGYPPEACGMLGFCTVQYVVEADGGVFPCDFYVLDEYKLGNLNTDSFAQLDAVRVQNEFIANSKDVYEDCAACPYFNLCRGGCKRNRIPLPNGSYGANVFCAAYRRFFAHAGARLQELARTVRA